MTNSIQTTTGR